MCSAELCGASLGLEYEKLSLWRGAAGGVCDADRKISAGRCSKPRETC